MAALQRAPLVATHVSALICCPEFALTQLLVAHVTPRNPLRAFWGAEPSEERAARAARCVPPPMTDRVELR